MTRSLGGSPSVYRKKKFTIQKKKFIIYYEKWGPRLYRVGFSFVSLEGCIQITHPKYFALEWGVVFERTLFRAKIAIGRVGFEALIWPPDRFQEDE